MSEDRTPVVRVQNLCVRDKRSGKELVADISFEVMKGECLGIVGESGSGKTLCCKALLGILPLGMTADGEAVFEGVDMLHTPERKVRKLRGTGISAIMQQPMTAFDPLYTLGTQLTEVIQEKLSLSKKESVAFTRESLKKVNLNEAVFDKYPHQLSGGMLQRCMIALNFALGARLIVADEPTTALDAQNQYEVLQRLRRMRQQSVSSLIFISHDLGAVQMLADRVLVMHKGRCVEQGAAEDVFNRPQNPYTQRLVETRLEITRAFENLEGETDAGH